MAELLRLIMDLVSLLFPFRLVHQSQRGVLFLWGTSPRCTLSPGIYFVLPWFTDVVPVSVVPHVYQTPLQTVAGVSFSASLVVHVTDAWAAFNTLELWHESAVELASAVLSQEMLAGGGKVDMVAVQAQLNRELAAFGLSVDRLRFLDYAEAPVIRLLNSQENRK